MYEFKLGGNVLGSLLSASFLVVSSAFITTNKAFIQLISKLFQRIIQNFNPAHITFGLSLLLCLWILGQTHPILAATKPPKTCRVGVYVLALRDLKPSEKSFGTDFWVWSVCPSADLKPLATMEIVTAKEQRNSHDSVLEKPNKTGSFEDQTTVFWAQRKVSAILKHKWDIRNFPFDQHILEIPIEEAIADSSSFVYTPDVENSSYQKNIYMEGWKIVDFKVHEQNIKYETTFGDPSLRAGASTFSRLMVSIAIRRDTVSSFLRLTAGVYASFATILLAFYLEPKADLGGRTGLLVGALFGTLVNMQGMDSMIGSAEGLTLMDTIHITALIYIFAAAIEAIYSLLLCERGREKAALWLDRKVCVPFFIISFTVANLILITHAIVTG